jgi:hypothetical protein
MNTQILVTYDQGLSLFRGRSAQGGTTWAVQISDNGHGCAHWSLRDEAAAREFYALVQTLRANEAEAA